MKVFVSGASGYIGKAVAAELARHGHHVYGLIRRDEAAKELRAMEIDPIVGDLSRPDSYVRQAAECACVVHCAAEYSARYMELDLLFVSTTLDALKKQALPRRFIYTSGVWVYGDTGVEPKDESSPLDPPELVRARVETERRVVASDSGQLRTIVVRPGCVYGGSGSLTGAWFESALDRGAAAVVRGEGARWAMVHLADLACLYRMLAESGLGGEIFNAAPHSESTVECAKAASEAAGKAGRIEVVPLAAALESMGPMAACLAFSQRIDSGKASRILGWQPRHDGFVSEAARCFHAWGASR